MGNNESSVLQGDPLHILGDNMVREHKNENVYDVYDLISILGEESMGVVFKVVKKDKSSHCATDIEDLIRFFGMKDELTRRENIKPKKEVYHALKTINFACMADEKVSEIRNEINILKSLDHPNIVRAFDSFETSNSISIAMELCTGGDLYNRMPYSEREASTVITQLLSAVSFMHHENMIHRDIKFENILFENRNDDAQIKLIDFGITKTYSEKKDNERCSTFNSSGTIYTMAPEIFDVNAECTFQSDMWSLGVVAFMLLSNKMPFWGNTVEEISQKIRKAQYSFRHKVWKNRSTEAKYFVASLLKEDPSSRFDADQAIHSSWLHHDFSSSNKRVTVQKDHIHKNFLKYCTCCVFKKISLMVIAYLSPSEDVVPLRQLFQEFDASRHGFISIQDFKDAMAPFESEENLNGVFLSMDIYGDGFIRYTGFIAATIEAQGDITAEKIEEAFEFLDVDSTGFISKNNLRRYLDRKLPDNYLGKLVHEVDSDGDGAICYQEFVKLFNN